MIRYIILIPIALLCSCNNYESDPKYMMQAVRNDISLEPFLAGMSQVSPTYLNHDMATLRLDGYPIHFEDYPTSITAIAKAEGWTVKNATRNSITIERTNLNPNLGMERIVFDLSTSGTVKIEHNASL